MKIILLHYSAPPIVGGVESVIGHHARLMADAGHEVCIVAGRGEQTDERIGFVSLPLVDSRHPVVSSIKARLDQGIVPDEFSHYVAELTQALQEVVAGADCVIAHNVCSLNMNLILTAALRNISGGMQQSRLILWHHDLAWTTPRYRAELHAGHPWDLLRTAWPGVDQVTISRFRQDELAALMGIPPESIWVIPNGVDVPRFLKWEPLSTDLVERLDLLNAYPILLLPVRITPRKNIELAIEVLAVMRATRPRASLIITGPLGPHNPANVKYFEKLKSLREKRSLDGNVLFLAELAPGYLPDEVISDFYSLADALLLPSREEGFGIPLLEAGLAGMPVFCADIPPLRDIGLNYVNYFSPDGSASDIASTILEHLSSSPLFEFRTHVRSHYTWREIYSKQIDLLVRKGVG
ncbi:MAG: glycosyltransferase family 4 protein [Bacteroidota bacterium]